MQFFIISNLIEVLKRTYLHRTSWMTAMINQIIQNAFEWERQIRGKTYEGQRSVPQVKIHEWNTWIILFWECQGCSLSP